MKWTKTIRFRFAFWAILLILGMLVAFGGFVYASLGLGLRTSTDDALSLSARETAAGLNVENGKVVISEAETPEESGSDATNARSLTLIVLSQDGSVLSAAGPYHSQPVPVTSAGNQAFFITRPGTAETGRVRAYILPVTDNGQVVGWVEAMQSLNTMDESLQSLLTALLVGGGIFSLLAGFAGYFLAARALAPIDHITRTAQRISTMDLSARLGMPDSGDEVSRLAATFNEMLDRIEKGFKRERQFTADASHELRTPLAAMQAILSVTREKERSTPEYELALADLSEETDRMRVLVEDLLRLARGENDLPPNLTRLDLSLLLSDVTDSLRPLAEAKGLQLTCDVPSSLPFVGDMDSLIRLFVNLLDNAIKYTERGSISLSARQEGDRVFVRLADTGIGIPPDQLPHIFGRFYRVDAARSTGGVGLGLAIARQIVQIHGGKISAESIPGSGTVFRVEFPIVPLPPDGDGKG